MIIISFGCGLGNQMYEYAFYLKMKEIYPNVQIKGDIKYILPQEHNGYELDKIFGINIPECSLKEAICYADRAPLKIEYLPINIIRFLLRKMGIRKKSAFVQKDRTEYYQDVFELDCKKNYYLLGVWANEKYFVGLETKLQNEIFLFPVDKLSEQSMKYKELIDSSNYAVSIHVRKGDYVQCENVVLNELYYEKAMNLIKRIQTDITYFVFSDDEEYVKELFRHKENIVYVTGNKGTDSWMDMYLMTICKANIIANSSFSFWGALLNKNDDKVVIAPNVPFKNCKNPFTCAEWITLDVVL